MAGLDLAKVVSVKQTYEWTETEWKLGSGYGVQITPRFHVVAFDYGVKKNILRMIAQRGARITVVPAQTPTVSSALPPAWAMPGKPSSPAPAPARPSRCCRASTHMRCRTGTTPGRAHKDHHAATRALWPRRRHTTMREEA